MIRMVLVTTLVVGVVACEKREEPQPKASAAQPYAGHPRTLHGNQPANAAPTPEPLHLAFRIDKVYDKQRPTATGLGHADGGTWVFFDARGADAEVFFDFDVPKKSGEWSEKDADYDKDVVGISAAEL